MPLAAFINYSYHIFRFIRLDSDSRLWFWVRRALRTVVARMHTSTCLRGTSAGITGAEARYVYDQSRSGRMRGASNVHIYSKQVIHCDTALTHIEVLPPVGASLATAAGSGFEPQSVSSMAM